MDRMDACSTWSSQLVYVLLFFASGVRAAGIGYYADTSNCNAAFQLCPTPLITPSSLPLLSRRQDLLESRRAHGRRKEFPLTVARGKGFGKKPRGDGEEDGKQDGAQEASKVEEGPSIIRPTFSHRGSSANAAGVTTTGSSAAPSPPSRKFQMLYTCNICEGRNLIQVDRVAFTEGIVVARCKHCDAKHLVADNLSKLDFGGLVKKGKEGESNPAGGKVTLDDILAARGEEAKYLDIKSNPELAAKYDLMVLEDGTVELAPKENESGGSQE